MSIKAAIKRHVRAGRLFPLEMSLESDPWIRGIFFNGHVKELLDGPWTAEECGSRVGLLQSNLESFVKGQAVVLCMEPYEADDAFMGRLHHPSEKVWDIRSRDPKPGLRLFGHFAAPDIFVAFDWGPRSKDWNGKQELGDRHSPLWEIVKNNCKEQWATLFPEHEALDGVEVHEFVTQNADARGSS